MSGSDKNKRKAPPNKAASPAAAASVQAPDYPPVPPAVEDATARVGLSDEGADPDDPAQAPDATSSTTDDQVKRLRISVGRKKAALEAMTLAQEEAQVAAAIAESEQKLLQTQLHAQEVARSNAALKRQLAPKPKARLIAAAAANAGGDAIEPAAGGGGGGADHDDSDITFRCSAAEFKQMRAELVELGKVAVANWQNPIEHKSFVDLLRWAGEQSDNMSFVEMFINLKQTAARNGLGKDAVSVAAASRPRLALKIGTDLRSKYGIALTAGEEMALGDAKAFVKAQSELVAKTAAAENRPGSYNPSRRQNRPPRNRNRSSGFNSGSVASIANVLGSSIAAAIQGSTATGGGGHYQSSSYARGRGRGGRGRGDSRDAQAPPGKS